MWRWIVEQLNITDELSLFPSWYMAVSMGVLCMVVVGLYLHYSQANNHVLSAAIITTLCMAIYERYIVHAYKSANLTLMSAVIYALLML